MAGRALSDQTILDSGIQEHPYPYYHLMHDMDPVHYDAQADLYLVSKHDLLVEAARNIEVFSSRIDMRTDVGGPDTRESVALFREKGWLVDDVLSQVDPPRHTQFRALVERLFTLPRVNMMEATIEKHVDQLIDGFIHRGEVDFFREFAVPLPLGLIADEHGVPRQDMGDFKVWSDAIIETLGIMLTAERRLECTRLIIDFQHYFVKKLDEARDRPRDDIISMIAVARLEQQNRELSTEEKLALIQQLLVAGNETTRNHLAKCMLLLIQNPGVETLLRSEPRLIPKFVEESLRLESPVQGLFRRVTRDYTLGETRLPAGAKVMLLFGAANRDPALFNNPDTLDIGRSNAHRHVAFSYGIHVCIGALLARKEISVAYRCILARMKNLALAEGWSTVDHLPNIILRGLRGLKITFAPVVRRGGLTTFGSDPSRS